MRAPHGAVDIPSTVRVAALPLEAGSTSTRGRLIGAAVLALALVATLAGSQLMGLRTVGRAAAVPVPLPPAVGSCLNIADDGTATVVDCAAPHHGELAMAWRAGIAPVAAGPLVRYPHFSVTRSISNPHIDTRCTGWVERYTGWDRYIARHDDDLWLAPQPLAVGRMVHGPTDASVADLAWTGCAVVTTEDSYVSSVRDAAFAPRFAATGPRPDVVSVCLDAGDGGSRFVSCEAPHNTELIGSINLTQKMMAARSVTLQHTAEEVAEGCRRLAAERVGREDPTFDGRLQVSAESIWQRSLVNAKPTSSAWLIPDCLLRVVGAGTLNRSLVEWGERPLPLS